MADITGILQGIANPTIANIAGAQQAGHLNAQQLVGLQQEQAANAQATQSQNLAGQILSGGFQMGSPQQQLAQQAPELALKIFEAAGIPANDQQLQSQFAQTLQFANSRAIAGDTEGASAAINQFKNRLAERGVSSQGIDGLLQRAQQQPDLIPGLVKTFEDIGVVEPASGAVEDRALRERDIAVKEQSLVERQGKLSAGLEKALLTAQDRTVEAQRSGNEFDVLANDFERLNLEGGLASTFSETLKGILGTQDDVTEFRRKFNKVRIGEGLKNLPPGPASDVDVKMAFRGVPPENAPATQVASFLRGAAKLARFEAGYNQFKADFISKNRSAAGINRVWRNSAVASNLKSKRKVTVAELYEAAQNRGITPEEVAQQLGIKTGLF